MADFDEPVSLGRKDDPAFAGEAEPETVNGQPEPEGQGEAETPTETDAQRNAREQQADATRKWQEAAEMRRQAEQRNADAAARERAIAAQQEALAPLRELDALVESNPELRATVQAHLQNYRPGSAKYATDEFVQAQTTQARQLAEMSVMYARTLLAQKYGDFNEVESQVAQTSAKYKLLQPGMSPQEVYDGLDAAYQLTTRPKAIAERKQADDQKAERNGKAATVGAGGGTAQRAQPQQELPTRRADGSLISYEELADMARGIKR